MAEPGGVDRVRPGRDRAQRLRRSAALARSAASDRSAATSSAARSPLSMPSDGRVLGDIGQQSSRRSNRAAPDRRRASAGWPARRARARAQQRATAAPAAPRTASASRRRELRSGTTYSPSLGGRRARRLRPVRQLPSTAGDPNRARRRRPARRARSIRCRRRGRGRHARRSASTTVTLLPTSRAARSLSSGSLLSACGIAHRSAGRSAPPASA